jgi:spore germination cell wall hydrolase CwlJ-like protein
MGLADPEKLTADRSGRNKLNFFKAQASLRRSARALAGAAALLACTSCVPDSVELAGPASPSDAAILLAQAPPPPPEPLLLKPVAPVEAIAINAAIPIVAAPNPRATSLVVRARTPIDQMRSLDCLAQAIYYEARSESEDGQRAVAQVVLNRMRHPTYPSSVCGVVYQGSERRTGCQFSFTCDGSLAVAARGFGWDRARRLAAEALAGKVYAPVGYSTHYHTVAVLPYWASSLAKTAVIGAHIFYRWNSIWGQPAAFRQRYAGVEPGAPAVLAQRSAIETRAALPAPTKLPLSIADLVTPAARPSAVDTVVTAPPDKLPQVKLTELGLPQSTIRERYLNSGAIKVRPSPELEQAASSAGALPSPAMTAR